MATVMAGSLCSTVNTFHDPEVTLRRTAKDSQCGLVAGAFMSSDRLGEAVELDQYGALIDAALRLGREAAGKESPSAGEDGGNGKLGVCVSCRGVGDRAITDDPVCLGHGLLPG
jgi:hypothetical protein